jgi:hypothetical protein
MKLIRYKFSFLIYALIVMQVYFLTSCNTKSSDSNKQFGKTGFLGFDLDMDYAKVKSVTDSLLDNGELQYFETTDILGNKQKDLYHEFSGISPALFAKVNLKGALMVDARLTSIQLTLCNRSDTGEQRFSLNCDLNQLNRLFELYKEKYGEPTLLAQGEQYDLLSKRISGVYSSGPKGRWAMDKIYFWERGNYRVYFDFGYPVSLTKSDNSITESDVSALPDSTTAPVIYYVFTQDYMDELLEKASRVKPEVFK